jgi:hypothetical protein
MLKDASPKVLDGAINEPKVGEAALTTNVVRMEEAVWVSVCVCEAVISVEPGATTVISPEELFTVATDVLELTKEKVPVLVVVGRVSKNGAAPYVLLSMTKSPYTGKPRLIVSTATMLAAVWFVPLACVIVRVVTPVLTIVTRPVVASIVAAAGLLLV